MKPPKPSTPVPPKPPAKASRKPPTASGNKPPVSEKPSAGSKPPVTPAAAPTDEHDPPDATPPAEPQPSMLGNAWRAIWQGASACTASMVVHFALLMAMGLWVIPPLIEEDIVELTEATMPDEEREDVLKYELEEKIETGETMGVSQMAYAEVMGAGGVTLGSVAPPVMESTLREQLDEAAEITIDAPLAELPPSKELINKLPAGSKGDPRAVVTDIEEAMDRITQELMWMLDEGPILVVWVFDQSNSMKDDQEEIGARIDQVYRQLGLANNSSSDMLETGVTSYGANFMGHLKTPTGDIEKIRQAIASVPVDPSGKEMMCQAVGRSIAAYKDYAKRTKRQMALILVTDESGDPNTNNQYLESAIAEAKSAKCRIYTLGREAVFGYPYAHMKWVHPQTGRTHYLPVDRGPETPFVEQLQISAFRRRTDAFPSGFGPYEQTRMSRETGGVFFMLPSLEAAIHRGEKRKYELEAMQAFRPDLRSRIETIAERDETPLQVMLWTVISDLNPYNPKVSEIIEMRVRFSPDPKTFVQQARTEQKKALIYLDYLARVQKVLEDQRSLRDSNDSIRWRANYDLIYAQVIAFQARVYEYGAYLEYFLNNPKSAEAIKGTRKFVGWHITIRRPLLDEPKSGPYVKKATELFEEVANNYPGTPWAALAEKEMNQGYGVDLVSIYDPIIRGGGGGGGKPIPIPKL